MFLIWYIQSQFPDAGKELSVYDWGGNQELPHFTANWSTFGGSDPEDDIGVLTVTPGFRRITNLLIVRDAENSAASAVTSIRNTLRKGGLAVPDGPMQWKEGHPRTAFLLFPTLTESPTNGTLEDLCIQSLCADSGTAESIEAVDEHLNKIQPSNGFARRHKNRLHTYLSGTDKYVGCKLGEAAQAGAFDWSSPLYEGLHRMIDGGLQQIGSAKSGMQ